MKRFETNGEMPGDLPKSGRLRVKTDVFLLRQFRLDDKKRGKAMLSRKRRLLKLFVGHGFETLVQINFVAECDNRRAKHDLFVAAIVADAGHGVF